MTVIGTQIFDPFIYFLGNVEPPCVEGLQKCSNGECVADLNDCPSETSEIQTSTAVSQGQPSGNVLSFQYSISCLFDKDL